MHINADALWQVKSSSFMYSSLQIFDNDVHPNMHNGDRKKEGLSLFSILNLTKTPMGRSLLMQWFMRPLLDIQMLNERLDAVQCFYERQDLISSLQDCLKHIKNIPASVERLNNR